jgi:hypothetical protein
MRTLPLSTEMMLSRWPWWCAPVGVDCHRARPQLLRAHVRKVDSGRARHAGRLRRVGVEAAGGDDGDAGVFPFWGGGSSGVAGAELVDAIVAGCVDEYA